MEHMMEYSSMFTKKHENKMHAKEDAPTMEKKDSSDTHPQTPADGIIPQKDDSILPNFVSEKNQPLTAESVYLDIFMSRHYFRKQLNKT